MNIYKTGEGKFVFKGDEALAEKLNGASYADTDISDLRVTADDLARLFAIAEKTGTVGNIKRYFALKDKYIKTYEAAE
ncbi:MULTISPECIES: hypothetical protein [Bacillus]|uniref:hypothetical protein n=1 Tax=Bacillus TaxID=1386 RepID=UPI00030CA09C|nr:MULTISPECIES: hypothetical protein [Bacillus]